MKETRIRLIRPILTKLAMKEWVVILFHKKVDVTIRRLMWSKGLICQVILMRGVGMLSVQYQQWLCLRSNQGVTVCNHIWNHWNHQKLTHFRWITTLNSVTKTSHNFSQKELFSLWTEGRDIDSHVSDTPSHCLHN